MGLIEELRRGSATEWIEAAAAAEGVSADELTARVLAGRAAIVANASRRAAVRPVAVGAGLKTKVNANIGTSNSASELAEEVVKLKRAIESGADAIMDLSTGGDLTAVRRELLSQCNVPLGTVPIYEAAVIANTRDGRVEAMRAQEMIDVVRRQAEQGVDFQTIHAAFTAEQAERVAASDRITGVVSRGGAILSAWMRTNGAENPFFERFDEVLSICAEHDVTLSLGDSLRPGCLADAGDAAQMRELEILGDLVLRAREAGVQVIVEGPGHVPLADVAEQMRAAKRLTHGAPLYVLGPLVVDIAPGYDHITAAIGGAIAASSGADFLCYVTRAEHVCLPDADDVAEGVIAARIAAHAGDIAKGIAGARDADDRMARARKALDWSGQFARALDPKRCAEMRHARLPHAERECSMCGPYCAMRLTEPDSAEAVEAVEPLA